VAVALATCGGNDVLHPGPKVGEGQLRWATIGPVGQPG
jgi:hypothetical protein